MKPCRPPAALAAPVVLALALPVCLAPTARAGTAYGLGPGGQVYRFDTANPAARVQVGHGPSSNPDGLTMDEAGLLYAISWSGEFWRVDPGAGSSILLGNVPLPGGTGFWKDLAWDPTNHRILGKHIGGPANDNLVAIDPVSLGTTYLGAITGFAQNGPQGFTLAAGPGGEHAVMSILDGYIYDLNGAAPGDPPLLATRRSVRALLPSGDLRGLEYESATGILYACPIAGIYTIGATGASTLLPGATGLAYRDLAFPIPAPASASAMLLVPLALRRRRASSQD